MSGSRGGINGAPRTSQRAERLLPAPQPQFLPLAHLHLDMLVLTCEHTVKGFPNLGGLRVTQALWEVE